MSALERNQLKLNAINMTDKQLDLAYDQASISGCGDICSIYFEEHERRNKLKEALGL